MGLRQAYARDHPGILLESSSRPEEVEAFVRQRGWLDVGEVVSSCEIAGEGNMNLVLRLKTPQRTVVLKQSRPWVERYDHIAAPLERAQVEHAFYRRVRDIPEVAGRMPRLLAFDPSSHCLLLEDLVGAQDMSFLYRRGELFAEDARQLGAYLRYLHASTRDECEEIFDNVAMRRLNHQHIFEVPLQAANGVDLDAFEPGLEAAASALRRDAVFGRAVRELARRYLADGCCLVHGDFFPGSWLSTPSGIRIIDPEFCFRGEPEVDLGVAVAHLVLSRQSFGIDQELIDAAVDPSPEVVTEEELVAQYAGVEVMRRLLGVAQLPIPPTDGFRVNMLDRARVAMLEGTLEAFHT